MVPRKLDLRLKKNGKRPAAHLALYTLPTPHPPYIAFPCRCCTVSCVLVRHLPVLGDGSTLCAARVITSLSRGSQGSWLWRQGPTAKAPTACVFGRGRGGWMNESMHQSPWATFAVPINCAGRHPACGRGRTQRSRSGAGDRKVDPLAQLVPHHSWSLVTSKVGQESNLKGLID